MIAALAICALAYLTFFYRHRGQGLSPDGKFYAAMAERLGAPSPYARRWLLPALLKSKRAWSVASGAAFIAVGPLMFALTDSLVMVWLMAWLPGFAINIKFPVLVDQVALALMLLAVVLLRNDYELAACLVLAVAAQTKESAGLFGAVICWASPWAAVTGVLFTGLAVWVGKARGSAPTEEFMVRPFRDALGRHDPLCWRSMLLPWGAIPLLCVATWSGLGEIEAVACVSLVLAYAQLAIARDESRLFLWAAPAVLMAVSASGLDTPWLGLMLVLHPFACGAVKRV